MCHSIRMIGGTTKYEKLKNKMNRSTNYKTHNVDAIETVINTILVHSLTSL